MRRTLKLLFAAAVLLAAVVAYRVWPREQMLGTYVRFVDPTARQSTAPDGATPAHRPGRNAEIGRPHA